MPIKTILTITALVFSFFAGYLFSGYEWSAEMEKEKAARAAEVAILSEQYRSKEHELAKNAKELDQKYTRDLSLAERRIDSLESSLADKSKRLRVKATCPSAVSSTSKSERESHGASPELDDGAKSAYFRLRKGLEMQYSQVLYLQNYIREQCLLD